MKLYIFILIFCVVLTTGCSESSSPEISDVLIGSWVEQNYSDEKIILKKTKFLDDNSYGIQFFTENKLIENKNAGWCGTPPVTYKKYEGIWKKLKENLYEIETGYWGGITKYKLEIIDISASELTVKYIYDNSNK